MKAVMLDSDTLGSDIDLQPLQALVDEFEVWPLTRPEEVVERVRGARIVITNKVVIDDDAMVALASPALIAVTATGTNNIDHDAARRRDVQIANVTAYGTASVAQHTMMMVLALATRLPLYQRDIADHRWEHSPFFCLLDHPVMQLAGKRMVIVGSGELGRAVAELARAFGMRVDFSARPGSEAQDERPALAELLPQADVVSLHCPLTEQSRHLLDAERLALMKSDALLINCGRGALIDEQAVLDALRQGHLGGLGVDVLPTEPPRDGHVLIDAVAAGDHNLIVTPHSAWASPEARQKVVELTADNIRRFLQGDD
ncbi:D-2-hydroxyacid dehydrogenase [Kushneria aurantia]|uniref:D-2-hydroxyacid dehydrogenase n=1 Tax=Kushneria aurantia TaxID=504092 RepID=A0ABV6G453_9GAMM|nr:D-2-hydroxyacid dehydrogenase [Kushneria aurantia]